MSGGATGKRGEINPLNLKDLPKDPILTLVTIHFLLHTVFSHLSKCFILVKVAVVLERILGTLSKRQEYTLVGTPIYCRAPFTHIHT